ncbi:MAG: bifunctional metallophosphatase/5'-nucleotidase [Hyphomicrobiales bacterium]|nr:MAG: bifunctional metallophosphatase/5'-nucleotidase [Hyphomicrobiales bacterium]
MSQFQRRVAAIIVAVLVVAAAMAGLRAWLFPKKPVELTIIAINDFHGNLKPPLGVSILDSTDKTKHILVKAGGAEHLATAVAKLREGKRNSIFVGAGDLIGASPLLSAIFNDEPTVQSLSSMGLAISAVGNHEFDDGAKELLRIQNGGCHPENTCRGPEPYKGAGFRYLAASTIVEATGKTLFPPYEIRTFDGIPVAFIGLTLKGTPLVVRPSGIQGLKFLDEAETVNALVPELTKQGVKAIVVLIHEGGFPTGDYNECPGISGPIVGIVEKLDKAVDIVVSGHTHKAYNCRIAGRLVTSADKFGTMLTEITVQLDPKTRDVISAKAENHIVRPEVYAKEPSQTALIETYDKLSRPLATRVVGSITETLSRAENGNGESALGDLIADAQLAATSSLTTGDAQIAVVNTGGIRTDILKRGEGTVTYEDMFAAQPFGNVLVTLTLTGAQIKTMLEQQWLDQPKPRPLQISKGFSYVWDDRRAKGDFVPLETITLNGQPIDPAASYRVTMNNFLSDGGDGFKVLTQGTNQTGGPPELQALEAYLKAKGPYAPGPLERIKKAY